MSRKAKPTASNPVTLAINEVPGRYEAPDKLIQPFEKALEALHISSQKMNVEIELPAHLWLMLAEIAFRAEDAADKNVGAVISELVFISPELRAKWMEAYQSEKEMLPKVMGIMEEEKRFKEKCEARDRQAAMQNQPRHCL